MGIYPFIPNKSTNGNLMEGKGPDEIAENLQVAYVKGGLPKRVERSCQGRRNGAGAVALKE